jgi:hypothetical protein
MTRPGLLVNPRAAQGKSKGPALIERLNADAGVSMARLDEFSQLEGHLHRFAADGVTHLFISSGDGTIQAIQTLLAEKTIFPAPPLLGLLPHGTTNMTAADLGFKSRDLDAQAHFIRSLNVTRTHARPTLRIVNPADGQPRHGMFMGTGAVSEATLYCQRVFNARGITGHWATFATLAGAAGKAAFARPNPHDPTRFDRPYDLALTADGAPVARGQHLMVIATTLEKLILNARPFWAGGGEGAIRASLFPYPVPNVFRWLLPMMYGGEQRRMPEGAQSIRATRLAISSRVSFVVDGEFFMAPEREALRVETGPEFTYMLG